MTEEQITTTPSANLSEIFAKMNMGELPAMSINVQKLVSLTNSQWSTSADLAKVILQDYSLTNKVLQVVNSAYYALAQPCNSISQAVNILGFDTIRDMAIAIALFEDFIKSGVDKEGISKLLARSFLSGTLARNLVEAKKINVASEETFICTMFHNLGKIILCIYLPEKYREIELKVDEGMPQNDACREVLVDLTYQEVGAEVAKFWNLSEKIVSAIGKNPIAPKHQYDDESFLQNLANFANMLVDCACNGSDLEPVFQKYGERLSVRADESIELLKKCVDISESVSETIRYGFSKLKIRSRLRNLEINVGCGLLNSDTPDEQQSRKMVFRSCGDEQEGLSETLDELPVIVDKAVNDCISEMNEVLKGPIEVNKFFFNLLNAIYRLLGFDRVILALVNMPPTKQILQGGFGFGEIDSNGPAIIENVLAQHTPCALSNAFRLCRDMMIPADKVSAFPDELQYLVKDRNVYLFPIAIKNKGIGVIYLDRKAEKPLLDQDMMKIVGLFRDFAVSAIVKIR